MSNAPVVFPVPGPLAGVAYGYANELARLGYAPASVRLQLKLFADLSEWLPKQGMAAANLTSSDLSRFLDDRRSAVALLLRIPMKSAMHSNLKPATASELKPAWVPI